MNEDTKSSSNYDSGYNNSSNGSKLPDKPHVRSALNNHNHNPYANVPSTSAAHTSDQLHKAERHLLPKHDTMENLNCWNDFLNNDDVIEEQLQEGGSSVEDNSIINNNNSSDSPPRSIFAKIQQEINRAEDEEEQGMTNQSKDEGIHKDTALTINEATTNQEIEKNENNASKSSSQSPIISQNDLHDDGPAFHPVLKQPQDSHYQQNFSSQISLDHHSSTSSSPSRSLSPDKSQKHPLSQQPCGSPLLHGSLRSTIRPLSASIIIPHSDNDIPWKLKNLDQNVIYTNNANTLCLENISNLCDAGQRKIFYEGLKHLLDSELKINIVTSFEDLPYSSTGIAFNTASFREGEKGMRVILCKSEEQRSRLKYIMEKESKLTEYCDLQLLEKLTVVIEGNNQADTYSTRLVMVTTEKPKMSLRRFLNRKMESKNMNDEQYRGSIRKLIRNVLFRHDACIASRNLNPNKILCLFKQRMVISELGESLVETNLDLRSGDTLDFQSTTLPFQEEISVYSSPAERAILRGENVATYDPFKSEIFSLGKIILEICLVKYANYFMAKQHIPSTVSVKSWVEATLADDKQCRDIVKSEFLDEVNEIILGKSYTQYYFQKGQLRKLRIPNVLLMMLDESELTRISSLKLALLAQSEKLLIRSRIQDPYPKFFPGVMSEDGFSILYPISNLSYEGEIDAATQEKHRKGLVKRVSSEDPTFNTKLVVEFGEFSKGRINGPVHMELFQEEWRLEGNCCNNWIHGMSRIVYKGQTVWAGYFSNFILKDWYENDVSDSIIPNVRQGNEMVFWIADDMEIIVNNSENTLTCWADQSLQSIKLWADIYDSESINTFKKISLIDCSQPRRVQQLLEAFSFISRIQLTNSSISTHQLLCALPKLQQLEISQSTYLSDEQLVILVSSATLQAQIKKLSLDNNPNITVKSLKQLAAALAMMPKLQYFSAKQLCNCSEGVPLAERTRSETDELQANMIQLVQATFTVQFVIFDGTYITNYAISKIFGANKKPIKWQLLSLNYCDYITKDGLRELLQQPFLTDLKKLDLMHCSHPKLDLPSKNMKASPVIINLAYSPGISSAQLEKFITRNSAIADHLKQISVNNSVIDSKARDSFKRLSQNLTLIITLGENKELAKITNAEVCLDILTLQGSQLFFTTETPVTSNDINFAFGKVNKSVLVKKIKFNQWKEGEFLHQSKMEQGQQGRYNNLGASSSQNNKYMYGEDDGSMSVSSSISTSARTSVAPSFSDSQSSSSQTLTESSQLSTSQYLPQQQQLISPAMNYKLRKNKSEEYAKDGIKLLGLYNYRSEETEFTVKVMTRIFSSSHLRNLSSLDLSGIPLDLESLLILTHSPHVQSIQTLNLSSQHITDQILHDFALSPHYSSLDTIILKDNNISFQGVNILLQAEYFQRLKMILTDAQSLSKDDLFHLASESLGMIKLRILGFFKNADLPHISPVEIKDNGGLINIVQIQIFGSNTNNINDKALYLIEGVRKDARLSKYSIQNVTDKNNANAPASASSLEAHKITYCSRIFDAMYKTTEHLTLALRSLTPKIIEAPQSQSFLTHFQKLSKIKCLHLDFMESQGTNTAEFIGSVVSGLKVFLLLTDVTIDISQNQFLPLEIETICLNIKQLQNQHIESFSFAMNGLVHIKQAEWKQPISQLAESFKQLQHLRVAHISLNHCTGLSIDAFDEIFKRIKSSQISKLSFSLQNSMLTKEDEISLQAKKKDYDLTCQLDIQI